ncbi:phosphatase PAP2 family protein [Cognatiyoonia koreensis]|uniref:phosphatase PAP2 family protein n=1 Tax=Cognatiyoonia koreensis TaxID=364200 RepID=UPI0013F4F39C|nr:phosphatase PAP2 family protein [Cognatiyoonia koreensis]
METILAFDEYLLKSINSLAGRSDFLDVVVFRFAFGDHLKGGVIMMLFWLAWGLGKPADWHHRSRMLSVLVVAPLAVLVARGAANFLPYRDRPIRALDGEINSIFGPAPSLFSDFSAFPSDHAVLFAAFSLALIFVNRKVGLFALAYTCVFICLPRIYLGLHWPADILGGVIIGGVFALILYPQISRIVVRRRLGSPDVVPDYVSYPLAFIITFETATLFRGSRSIAQDVISLFV